MKIKKWLTNALRWINILLILGTLLSYLAAFVSPQPFWILSLFGLAYPLFLVLNIIFFFVFVSLKSRTAILSLACILLGWNYLSVMYASNSSNVSSTNNNITVCSFNVESLYTYRNNATSQNQYEYEDEASFAPYRKFFDQASSSIICLQEHFPKNSYFNKYFQKNTPFSIKGNLSIYSKFPIINQGQAVETAQKTNGAIFADLKIDTAIIRVYNVHLQSTGIAPEAQKIANDENLNLESEATKSSIRKIVGGLKRASQKRAEQVDQLIKHINGSPYPVIVCGDFNDTPYSYSYQQIKGGLKDSFLEKGNGFGVTYNGPIPTLRIDYILGSPSLNFLSHKIINSKVSDHYPIVSEISF